MSINDLLQDFGNFFFILAFFGLALLTQNKPLSTKKPMATRNFKHKYFIKGEILNKRQIL